jgi:hypothetical protein
MESRLQLLGFEGLVYSEFPTSYVSKLFLKHVIRARLSHLSPAAASTSATPPPPPLRPPLTGDLASPPRWAAHGARARRARLRGASRCQRRLALAPARRGRGDPGSNLRTGARGIHDGGLTGLRGAAQFIRRRTQALKMCQAV